MEYGPCICVCVAAGELTEQLLKVPLVQNSRHGVFLNFFLR